MADVDRGPLVCGAIAALMRETSTADPAYQGMRQAYEAAMAAAGFDLPLNKVCERCAGTSSLVQAVDTGGWVCAWWHADACQDRAAKAGRDA